MHPFERRARQYFEDQVRYAAEALGCDISHVIFIAAEQMRVLAEGVKKGRADDASDIRAARGDAAAKQEEAE